jgi:TrpR-related protein YerC/YecD
MVKLDRVTESNWNQHPWVETVASALCLQRNKQDMKNFLRDLCTLKELQAFGERIEVAKYLTKDFSYREVAQKTGASTSTVTRVAKFLTDGAGGYKKYFKYTTSSNINAVEMQGLQALIDRKQRQTDDAATTDSALEDVHDSIVQKKPKSLLQKFL